MSSATDPIFGISSDIQRPLLPCCLNSRRVPRSFGVSLENVSMKAKRLPFRYDSGVGLESYFCNSGL